MNIIELKSLTKTYDNFILGPINLTVPSGNIIGLIGENGAGKTTLIKSILGIIGYDKGEVLLWKEPISKNLARNEKIGVVLDNMFFPELLKPTDINLIMKQAYQNWDEPLFYSYLEQFQIPKNSPLKSCSKGMRKKIEIATALSHHPELLILDEPTSGLDPVVRAEILDIFLNFIQDENHTILLSTHITSDLEHIADYIVFLDKGKIIVQEDKDTLQEEYAILKCDETVFQTISNSDMIRFRKNKYSYDILIKNKQAIQKKYPSAVIDKITLEDLMVLYIKGLKGETR